MDFAHQYGPWALIAGASDGVGRAFAETLAQRGLNIILLARRETVLREVASGIEQHYGVDTRILALDLSFPDVSDAILAAVGDLDIGLFIYCAGADPDYRHFLDNSLAAAESMLHRNCTVPMQLCHHLAGAMVGRGRGGIVILGSGAGIAGSGNMVAYAASKAFDMVFTEALWCELQPEGVDVLGLILGETDTPALRRLREERGLAGPDEPVSHADTPQQVVDDALANLNNGPTRFVNKPMRWGMRLISPIPRNSLVKMMSKAAAKTMGADPKSS